jgi:hypothetical protein
MPTAVSLHTAIREYPRSAWNLICVLTPKSGLAIPVMTGRLKPFDL